MATVDPAYQAYSGTDGFGNPQATVKWKVYDAETFQEAMSALYDGSVATFDVYGDGTLILRKSSIQVDEAGGNSWDGTVIYELAPRKQLAPPAPDASPEFSFASGGGTKRITRSLETIGRFPTSNTAPDAIEAPDFKGAVGVSSNGVDGVDIIDSDSFNWTETHYLTNEVVTWEYRRLLATMRGKVNNEEFRGFAAGEVLLVDFEGSKRGSDDWQITFKFSRSANVEETTIGDIDVYFTDGPAKKGWEYLWVWYQPTTQQASVNGSTVDVAVAPNPSAVYVEKVYEEADFSALEIGTEEEDVP